MFVHDVGNELIEKFHFVNWMDVMGMLMLHYCVGVTGNEMEWNGWERNDTYVVVVEIV